MGGADARKLFGGEHGAGGHANPAEFRHPGQLGRPGADATGAPFVLVSEWELKSYKWNLPPGTEGALDSTTHLIWAGDSEGDVWSMEGLYHFPMVYIDSNNRPRLGLETTPSAV